MLAAIPGKILRTGDAEIDAQDQLSTVRPELCGKGEIAQSRHQIIASVPLPMFQGLETAQQHACKLTQS